MEPRTGDSLVIPQRNELLPDRLVEFLRKTIERDLNRRWNWQEFKAFIAELAANKIALVTQPAEQPEYYGESPKFTYGQLESKTPQKLNNSPAGADNILPTIESESGTQLHPNEIDRVPQKQPQMIPVIAHNVLLDGDPADQAIPKNSFDPNSPRQRLRNQGYVYKESQEPFPGGTGNYTAASRTGRSPKTHTGIRTPTPPSGQHSNDQNQPHPSNQFAPSSQQLPHQPPAGYYPNHPQTYQQTAGEHLANNGFSNQRQQIPSNNPEQSGRDKPSPQSLQNQMGHAGQSNPPYQAPNLPARNPDVQVIFTEPTHYLAPIYKRHIYKTVSMIDEFCTNDLLNDEGDESIEMVFRLLLMVAIKLYLQVIKKFEKTPIDDLLETSTSKSNKKWGSALDKENEQQVIQRNSLRMIWRNNIKYLSTNAVQSTIGKDEDQLKNPQDSISEEELRKMGQGYLLKVFKKYTLKNDRLSASDAGNTEEMITAVYVMLHLVFDLKNDNTQGAEINVENEIKKLSKKALPSLVKEINQPIH